MSETITAAGPVEVETKTTVSPKPARIADDSQPNEYANWRKRRLGVYFSTVLLVAVYGASFYAIFKLSADGVEAAEGILIALITNATVFTTAVWASWFGFSAQEDVARIGAGYDVGGGRSRLSRLMRRDRRGRDDEDEGPSDGRALR